MTTSFTKTLPWIDPKSGWKYYTVIKPKRKRLIGEEGNEEYTTELKKCFDLFLDECFISIEKIQDSIEKDGKYSLVIDTHPNNNVINENSDYHVTFLKSKFLENPRFKKALIEHYNYNGIFVKGPRELIKNDKTKINKWVIEFLPHHSSNNL